MSEHDLPAILGGVPTFPAGPPSWPPTWPGVKSALDAALADGSWGRYHGPHVRALEADLCARFGVEHALTCASGTVAVEAALRAVGVGPGDEVILAAYEYEANFLTVHTIGAKPVLVDVAPDDWNLAGHQLDAALTPTAKAIVCTHLHGGLVPMRVVTEFARENSLAVVEDAAQVPGAVVEGRPAGSWGDVGTLSFGGSKLLSAGRGGAILFHDARVCQRSKLWLSRGIQQWAALSEIQACVLRPQLAVLDALTTHRLGFVQRCSAALDHYQVRGLTLFHTRTPDSTPAFYKVGFRYETGRFGLSRDSFVRAMRAEGVAFDPGFRGLHVGRSPSRFRAVGDLTHATEAHHQCVVLHHPVALNGGPAADQVVRAVAKVYRNADRIRSALP